MLLQQSQKGMCLPVFSADPKKLTSTVALSETLL
jgi:hypothetical protein